MVASLGVVGSKPDDDAGPDTIGHLPEDKSGSLGEQRSARDALRQEIRRLATQALTYDPLNATAFRLLGETATDTDEARILMQEAVKRSRRETLAVFWLLNDSYYRRDLRSVLAYADLLLRTRPELSNYTLGYVTLIAEDPEARSILVEKLAQGPSWRSAFFSALARDMRRTDAPLELMMLLKQTQRPSTANEFAFYLNALISKGTIGYAYNALLQFLPEDEIEHLGLIQNAGFQRNPSGLPFDWQIKQAVNAVVDFTPLSAGQGRALHFTFGDGRIQFPEVSQILLLPAGKYSLEGKLRGRILGKRGVRWQLQCVGGKHQMLGETDLLSGHSQEWRAFSLQALIPKNDCEGQLLRLFHDSRSASEEFLSGEAWFAALHLTRSSEDIEDR
jgi:hypothetical protein